MFETLFSYGATKRRHQQGPLSAQRDAYLKEFASTGAAHGMHPSESILHVAAR